jgi:Amidase
MPSFPLTMPSQSVRKVAHGEGASTGSARDYLDALDTIAAMKRSFEAFFERFDFLLTPTTAAMPWPARDSRPSVVNGKTRRCPRSCGLHPVRECARSTGHFDALPCRAG